MEKATKIEQEKIEMYKRLEGNSALAAIVATTVTGAGLFLKFHDSGYSNEIANMAANTITGATVGLMAGILSGLDGLVSCATPYFYLLAKKGPKAANEYLKSPYDWSSLSGSM